MKVVCIEKRPDWMVNENYDSKIEYGKEYFVGKAFKYAGLDVYWLVGFPDCYWLQESFADIEPNFTNEVTKALADSFEELKEYNPKEIKWEEQERTTV